MMNSSLDMNNSIDLVSSSEEQLMMIRLGVATLPDDWVIYGDDMQNTVRGSVVSYSDCEDDGSNLDLTSQTSWQREEWSQSLTPHFTWSSSESEYEEPSLSEPLVPSVIEEREEQTSPKHHITNTGVTSFWRYRKVAKGPQSKQYKLNISAPKDPNVPIIYRDPAFTKDAAAHNLSHFGKARTGQATDMSPSPSKLIKLREEIRTAEESMVKLGTSIKIKRQRIKISGKISRLRKTSNLEANKIMLSGLQKQKEELTDTISVVTKEITSHHLAKNSLSQIVSDIVERGCKTRVAGMCGDYVDMVLRLEDRQC